MPQKHVNLIIWMETTAKIIQRVASRNFAHQAGKRGLVPFQASKQSTGYPVGRGKATGKSWIFIGVEWYFRWELCFNKVPYRWKCSMVFLSVPFSITVPTRSWVGPEHMYCVQTKFHAFKIVPLSYIMLIVASLSSLTCGNLIHYILDYHLMVAKL